MLTIISVAIVAIVGMVAVTSPSETISALAVIGDVITDLFTVPK